MLNGQSVRTVCVGGRPVRLAVSPAAYATGSDKSNGRLGAQSESNGAI